MHRARASIPPEAIRIEDEVWQEAFSERPRSRRRLRSLEGGRSADQASIAGVRPVGVSATRRISGPVAAPPAPPRRASRPAVARADAFPIFDVSELPPLESSAAELTPTMRAPSAWTDLPAEPSTWTDLPAEPVAWTDLPAEPSARTDLSADPAAPAARRTVTISGRGAERNLPWHTDASRRRSAKRVHERSGFRPDRFAMWALLLGLLLVLVAATSAHA